MLQQAHASGNCPAPSLNEVVAYYNVDKKEVSDRHWPLVVDILRQFGLSANDETRTLLIPFSVCEQFEEKVLTPWQHAWRQFRDSRKRGAAQSEESNGSALADVRNSTLADNITVGSHGGRDGSISDLSPGDTIFTWGCLDWVTSNMSMFAKKGHNPRSAFIVSVPELLDLPKVLSGQRIVQIAAGSRHTLVCTEKGEAFAWGRGLAGQLGVVALGCTAHPSPLQSLALGGQYVISVSCGQEHSCVLTRDGAVFSFGSGKRGQTGLNTTETMQLPSRMRWNQRLVQCAAGISCGSQHTAVMLSDGSLLTCGAAEQGVLGHGNHLGMDEQELARTSDALQLQAVAVLTSTKTPLAAISCGGMHNLALTRSNATFAFGAGSWGRLGLGSSDSRDKHLPTKVKAAEHLGQIKQVAAGFEHSLLLH